MVQVYERRLGSPHTLADVLGVSLSCMEKVLRADHPHHERSRRMTFPTGRPRRRASIIRAGMATTDACGATAVTPRRMTSSTRSAQSATRPAMPHRVVGDLGTSPPRRAAGPRDSPPGRRTPCSHPERECGHSSPCAAARRPNPGELSRPRRHRAEPPGSGRAPWPRKTPLRHIFTSCRAVSDFFTT